MARARVRKRTRARRLNAATLFGWLGGTLGEVDDLAFGNAANVIEMETAFAFSFFGIDAGTHEREDDQTNRENGSHAQSEDQLPIGEQFFQLLPLGKITRVEFGISVPHQGPF